jgi:hypothetical protein
MPNPELPERIPLGVGVTVKAFIISRENGGKGATVQIQQVYPGGFLKVADNTGTGGIIHSSQVERLGRDD